MELPVMKTRACLALAEETEFARQALYVLLSRFPADAIRSGDATVEDNVRGILCHTTVAILSYSCWMRKVLGRMDPALEKDTKTAFLERVRSLVEANGFEEASREASSHYYETLAGMDEADLEREFTSNWGATMGIEMMMEHALVHLLRHRRQLEILLGDRPQAAVHA